MAAGTSGRNAQLSRARKSASAQPRALEKDKDRAIRGTRSARRHHQSPDTKEAELKATQAKLDRSNPQARECLNAQFKTHRERVVKHNQTPPAFNAQAAALRAGEGSTARSCKRAKPTAKPTAPLFSHDPHRANPFKRMSRQPPVGADSPCGTGSRAGADGPKQYPAGGRGGPGWYFTLPLLQRPAGAGRVSSGDTFWVQ